MGYRDGDMKVLYEVRAGYVDRGLDTVDAYGTREEARWLYDEIDIRNEWELEKRCGNRTPADMAKELALYIYRYDGERWEPWDQPADDILLHEEYGADDHAETVDRWMGEGWYRIMWTGGTEDGEPRWYDYQGDLADDYASLKGRFADGFNLPYVEWMGDGFEPDYGEEER